MKTKLLALALAAATLTGAASISHAGVSIGVSVNLAPPALPVYEQPPIPDDGYLWTPGYWAWGPDGYYWVPGTWVRPPRVGYLWTPGYWGWGGGGYFWHQGYWGPHVGFYGGVNYGYGYGGAGFEGGYWRGGRMYYNRSVTNIRNTVVVKNVYNKTVVNNVTVNRVSYNGGNGIHAQPSAAEQSAARDRHVAFTADQRSHEEHARADRSLRASVNNGHPALGATAMPARFNSNARPANAGRGVQPRDIRNDRPVRNDRPAPGAQPAQIHDHGAVHNGAHNDRPPNGARQPSAPAEQRAAVHGSERGREGPDRDGPGHEGNHDRR